MTKRTSDADRLKTAVVIERAFHTDDGIQLQQRERRRRIVEIHTPVLQLLDERFGQRVGVDFQADRERRLRTHAWANTAELLAGQCALQLQSVRPECFIAERIKAESLFAFVEHPLCVRVGLSNLAAAAILSLEPARIARSEERRVGKECRS